MIGDRFACPQSLARVHGPKREAVAWGTLTKPSGVVKYTGGKMRNAGIRNLVCNKGIAADRVCRGGPYA
jgi:hypothetical protein